jgi:hypothetical protein
MHVTLAATMQNAFPDVVQSLFAFLKSETRYLLDIRLAPFTMCY